MSRYSSLNEIRQLDPVKDHVRIVCLDTCYEFPFDIKRSLEFAFFHTYAIPSIAELLDKTGELGRFTQKRYDDSDIILSNVMEYGYDSERGRAAIRRMNQLHGRYNISNDDYLYVLSTLIYEPARWIARYGWRAMCDQEKLAHFYFWRQVGHYMNIKSIPESYAEFERFNIEYERKNFRPSEASKRVGNATRDLFISWFLPKFLWPLGYPGVYAMMDSGLLNAFDFQKPPVLVRQLVTGSLKLRGQVLRMLPPRRRPKSPSNLPHRSYPDGYKLEEVGPAAPTSIQGHQSDPMRMEKAS